MNQKYLPLLKSVDMALHCQQELAEIGLQSEYELILKLKEINKLLTELIKELQHERESNE